jgi:superfamily II DNA/RNA helicase
LDIPSVDLVIQLEPPKKVDDYIHRSGRTGRAGKKGVCLTIYLKNEEYLLRNIERVANIKFRDIGPPQQDDLLNRLTIDLIHHLKNIDENILDYFEWLASEMIYEMGSEKALARALAHITGVTKRIACTSVMNKQPGMITYKFKYAPSATKKVELQPEDLIRYLEDRLQTGEKKVANIAEIVKGTVKTVTAKCLAFEFPELYMKKMEPLQHENHSEYEIIRVSALSQLTSEQA